MTKKEEAFIRVRIKQLRSFAVAEAEDATNANDAEEREHHWNQERLNNCAAETLENLLLDLGALKR